MGNSGFFDVLSFFLGWNRGDTVAGYVSSSDFWDAAYANRKFVLQSMSTEKVEKL